MEDDNSGYLEKLTGRPFACRMWGYLRLGGPGYLQSAMALGAGTLSSCVVLGSLLGYESLWVQAPAMVVAYAVLAAVAKQVCHTGKPPYRLIWDRLHPSPALLWGVSALLVTVIWSFPQYTFTANGVVSFAQAFGVDLGSRWGRAGIGIILLGGACFMVRLYLSGSRGMKVFEAATKIMVWTVVAAFAVAAILTGIQWKRLILGLMGVSFLRRLSDGGVPQEVVTPVLGSIAAAIGINMVFLYPYSLLYKGWGRRHKRLAYSDLLVGMAVPFILATGLVIITVANTVGPPEGQCGMIMENILKVVPVLGPALGKAVRSDEIGDGLALLVVGIGMTSMGFAGIITQMLAAGFVGCELFGFDHRGRAKWYFSLAPIVGVYGVTLLETPWQAALTVSSLTMLVMPITVACFLLLLNKKSVMEDDAPRQVKRLVWNAALVFSVLMVSVAAYFTLRTNWQSLMVQLKSSRPGITNTMASMEARTGAGQLGATAQESVLEPGNGGQSTQSISSTCSLLKETFTHRAMGTEFTFTMHARPDDTATDAIRRIADEAFQTVDDLEARLSRYRTDSQITYINNRAAAEPVRVAPDVVDLLLLVKTVYEESSGAFDPTVGPLLKRWGFYDKTLLSAPPTQEELAEILVSVGFDKVQIHREERTISFARPGMSLDLGGVAKGWALDQAAAVLKRHGVSCAVLDAGTSTVVALGAPPGEAGWTVSVRNPYNSTESDFLAEITLCDEAFSASGTGERFVEIAGKQYAHIIDPRNGNPVEGVLCAVAVAPSGALSDALSTAFFVMGVEATKEYCGKHPEVRAMIAPATAGGEGNAQWFNFPEK